VTNTVINVDGTDYDVERTGHKDGDRVVVWSMNERFVGDVEYSERYGNFMVDLEREGDPMEVSYNNFGGQSTEEIAKWIVRNR
jgi:hypothetical protein